MSHEIRPFLRWAGSKRQILHRLEPFCPDGARYVEPFAGSACFFFRLGPPRAILGDINRELISTYRAVRDDAAAVHQVLSGYCNSAAAYKKIRSVNPPFAFIC
jgi:DNA adenine methylase